MDIPCILPHLLREKPKSEDIYYSKREGDTWSAPIRLEGEVNTDDQFEGFPSVSSDEKKLYFIRVNRDYPFARKSREDCFQIYVSNRNTDGSWGLPELLPDEINSPCVRDPKIMADNRTLLFSALDPEDKEKFDLYQSQFGLDSIWSEPVYLEYVNTELNNQSPAIPASGEIMYFYSQGDLFKVNIPPEYRQFFNKTLSGSGKKCENQRTPGC